MIPFIRMARIMLTWTVVTITGIFPVNRCTWFDSRTGNRTSICQQTLWLKKKDINITNTVGVLTLLSVGEGERFPFPLAFLDLNKNMNK